MKVSGFQLILILLISFTGCARFTHPSYKIRKENSKTQVAKSYKADSIYFEKIYYCDYETFAWDKTNENISLTFRIDSLFKTSLEKLIPLGQVEPDLTVYQDYLCFERTMSKKQLRNVPLSHGDRLEIVPILKLTRNMTIVQSGGGGIEIPGSTDLRNILLSYRLYLLVSEGNEVVYLNNSYSYEDIEIHKDDSISFYHNPQTIKAMINEAMEPFVERLE